MFPNDFEDENIEDDEHTSVVRNDKDQLVSVELRDDKGNLVIRETYEYDKLDRIQKRNGFGADGTLFEYELWTWGDDGHLSLHELYRADSTPVFTEKWTRDEAGKLLFAEDWEFDETGKQVNYKKFLADTDGHIAAPPTSWSQVVMRALSLILGGVCFLSAISAYKTGDTASLFVMGALALLNFWNGVKKR